MQMQFASVVTEFYEDALVGSSIENGTTDSPVRSAQTGLATGVGDDLDDRLAHGALRGRDS